VETAGYRGGDAREAFFEFLGLSPDPRSIPDGARARRARRETPGGQQL